jgi:hypothetical protein
MTVAQVILVLEARGFRLWLDGEKIKYRPTPSAAELNFLRDRKPEVREFLETRRPRPATCSSECYEIEPGKWIHRPWTGCTTIQPEVDEPEPAASVQCGHCQGEGECACIACYKAGPGRCVACHGKGVGWR